MERKSYENKVIYFGCAKGTLYKINRGNVLEEKIRSGLHPITGTNLNRSRAIGDAIKLRFYGD